MGAQQADQQPAPAVKADPPAAPAVDERDAAIARLERALAEERDGATKLRATIEGQRFQLQVLEKGYSKQLADARQKLEKAEQELNEHKTRAATLGTGGEDTLKLLGETRAELARANADREQLRTQLAARSAGQAVPRFRHDPEAVADGTINQLMSASDWVRERKAAADGHLHAQVQAEPEAPVEMIAPELVFTRSKKDDEDDER